MNRIRAVAWLCWIEMVRRKEAYVLIMLLGALLSALVSLPVFGLSTGTAYVKDLGLIMAWIFSWILAVNVSTRQLPDEEKSGTVYSLLAKPITRIEWMAGKWLGTTFAVSVALAIFYILIAIVVISRAGHVTWSAYAQGFALHAAVVAVLTAAGILASTRLNQDAAATLTFVMSAAAFIVVPRIPAFLAMETGALATMQTVLYHLLPHFEIMDMRMRIAHDLGRIRWITFATLLLYAGAWIVFLLSMAWLAYRRKRFTRNGMAM